jgi:hypothetical protein
VNIGAKLHFDLADKVDKWVFITSTRFLKNKFEYYKNQEMIINIVEILGK